MLRGGPGGSWAVVRSWSDPVGCTYDLLWLSLRYASQYSSDIIVLLLISLSVFNDRQVLTHDALLGSPGRSSSSSHKDVRGSPSDGSEDFDGAGGSKMECCSRSRVISNTGLFRYKSAPAGEHPPPLPDPCGEEAASGNGVHGAVTGDEDERKLTQGMGQVSTRPGRGGRRRRVWTVGDALLGIEGGLAAVDNDIKSKRGRTTSLAQTLAETLILPGDGNGTSDPEARSLLVLLAAHLGCESLEEASSQILGMSGQERSELVAQCGQKHLHFTAD